MFLQSLLPPAAKDKQAPAGMPAPASHGWLCCRARIVARSHPKTLRIFPGSCSVPSAASPSSSALVHSPRCRPPVLPTWSTTERNKEMHVHGEDDSRDPAAHALILFFWDREGYQLGCAGAVARLAHDFISYVYHMTNPFFSFLASQTIFFFAE